MLHLYTLVKMLDSDIEPRRKTVTSRMIVFQLLVLFLCAGCGSVATDPRPNPDESEPDGLSPPSRVLEDPVSNRRDAGAARGGPDGA